MESMNVMGAGNENMLAENPLSAEGAGAPGVADGPADAAGDREPLVGADLEQALGEYLALDVQTSHSDATF
jgi:hypothetical protein